MNIIPLKVVTLKIPNPPLSPPSYAYIYGIVQSWHIIFNVFEDKK